MKFIIMAFMTLATAHVLTAQATTVLYKNFNNLVDESDHVVGGTVSKTVSKKERNGEIFTVVTLKDAYIVNEMGTINANKPVLIRMKGGDVPLYNAAGKQIGVEGVHAHGAPELFQGAKVILFISNNGRAEMPIYGWQQGVFYVNESGNVMDAENVPVVGLDGAHIVRGTPQGPVSNGRRSIATRTSQGGAAAVPTLIDSHGGKDTLLSTANDTRTVSPAISAVPVHVSNFLSMIQERRRGINQERTRTLSRDTADLFELPPIDHAKANKSVRPDNARLDSEMGSPNPSTGSEKLQPPRSRPTQDASGE